MGESSVVRFASIEIDRVGVVERRGWTAEAARRCVPVLNRGEAIVVRSMEDQGTITRILTRTGQSADAALAEAIASVYGDLRRIAGRLLTNERYTPTFDPETLVHEAYLRLVEQDRTAWCNRQHLFAVAARIMRRILVDRARHQASAKRGGGISRTTTLDGKDLALPDRRLDILVLDDAVSCLERHDGRLAELVELRFFGGMNNNEIAAIQGVTTMTVIRRWRLARAWLHRHLVACGEAAADSASGR